jgi:L-arabinose isomerase
MDMSKAKVGLLGLMLELYDRVPGLKPRMASFAAELGATLAPYAEVDFPGVCSTREAVDATLAGFERDGKDLIIVVLLTYAPSHIALTGLLRTRVPVLIYNTQQLRSVTSETTGDDTTCNHGMHGVQDLANVLLRAGRPCPIVTGHYLDPATRDEVGAWCIAARAARFVRQLQIGLIGYPMEGMGDFGLDDTAFLSGFGAQVQHIAMRSVAEYARAAPQQEIAAQMEQDRAHFRMQEDITPAEHEASARLEWALRRTLIERGLHGFTSHFMAVSEEGWLDTLPFLAASKLMGEGYGFGGEGDVTSAAAVALMAHLTGAANFTEMFTMDFAHNAVLMMHMGEGNWKMARRDEPVRMLRSTLGLVDLRVAPLLLAFSLEPGEATLVSLFTGPGGRLKLLATEGAVADFPYVPDMGRPHYKFAPAVPLGEFLTRYSQVGGSHHLALSYGRWAGAVEKLAALLGVDYARI